MYQNYIFDLYGTLIDINTNEKKPYLWQKLADFYCAAGAFYDAATLKRRYDALYKRALIAHPEPFYELEIGSVFETLYQEKNVTPSRELIELTASFFRILSRNRFALYPGVASLFQKIRAHQGKIYLLSNAQALFTVPELKQAGIYDAFDGMILSSDVSYAKPSRQIMEALLSAYPIALSDSIMIGNDRGSDIQIANDFQMDSLLLITDSRLEEEAQKKSKKITATFEICDGDFSKIAGYLFP